MDRRVRRLAGPLQLPAIARDDNGISSAPVCAGPEPRRRPRALCPRVDAGPKMRGRVRDGLRNNKDRHRGLRPAIDSIEC